MTTFEQDKAQYWSWWAISIVSCAVSAWFIAGNTGARSLTLSSFMMFLSVSMGVVIFLGRPESHRGRINIAAFKKKKASSVVIKTEKSHSNAQVPTSTSKHYTTPPRVQNAKVLMIDCAACKSSESMKKTKIPRFTGLLRFIGFLIALPSAAGVGFALLVFFSTIMATNEVMPTASTDAEAAGAAIGATIGIGFAAFIGFSSLIGGLVGWILLMKKKVFKCVNCGYVMDRG